MTHITTCSVCGKAYEETCEESANAQYRECCSCWRMRRDEESSCDADREDIEDVCKLFPQEEWTQ
jgi:hypothetical protein